jgi:TatD DNase family protein
VRLVDTHCHLDLAAFDTDREIVIARASAAGVIGMLVPAIRPRTWPALIAMAAAHAAAGVRIALGIHPQIVPALDDDEGRELDVDALADRIAAAVRAAGDACVAVGECGLDGATAKPERQQAILRAHVRAARAVKRPVVIHVLRAHDVAPRLLREERIAEVGGVLHSYSGGADLVPIYAELGLCFSFAGPATYRNARKPLAAARAIPADRLLVETDAPDQAPTSHRGSRSEPSLLPEIVAALAAARACDAEHLAALTTANSHRLFAAWC